MSPVKKEGSIAAMSSVYVGRGKFIGHRRNFLVVARARNHVVNKTRPIRSKDPRNANDQVAFVSKKHVLFAFALRFSIHAQRFRGIIFEIRRVLAAVENIIGAEMNQLGAFVLTDVCQKLRSAGINFESLVSLFLTEINIGHGRAVDQQVERQWLKQFFHLVKIGQIDFRVGEAAHFKLLMITTEQR